MTRSHALTGLCSWMLRACTGQYIYDPVTHTTGYGPAAAHLWLWTPEEVASQVAKLEPTMLWAGRIEAVRAR